MSSDAASASAARSALLDRSLADIIKDAKAQKPAKPDQKPAQRKERREPRPQQQQQQRVAAAAPYASSSSSSAAPMLTTKSVFVGSFAFAGVPEDVQNEHVKSLFADAGIKRVKEVSLEGGADGKPMHMVCQFETFPEAKAAIATLNGRVVPFAPRPLVAREDAKAARAAKEAAAKALGAGAGAGAGAGGELAPFKVQIGGGAPQASSGGELRVIKKGHVEHPASGGARAFSVRVSNIPTSLVDDELRSIFASCGAIVEARIARRRDGKPEGFGTVSFSKRDGAVRAVREFHEAVIKGAGGDRTISVAEL
jgi:RNA recognition motif-containing protein